MTFITSDPTAPYRHALNAWVSPLATCALPKGVRYLLTYLRVCNRVCAFRGATHKPNAPRTRGSWHVATLGGTHDPSIQSVAVGGGSHESDV